MRFIGRNKLVKYGIYSAILLIMVIWGLLIKDEMPTKLQVSVGEDRAVQEEKGLGGNENDIQSKVSQMLPQSEATQQDPDDIRERAEKSKIAGLAHYVISKTTHDQLYLPYSSFGFVSNNHTLFPATTSEDVKKAKSITYYSIDSDDLDKDWTKHVAKMLHFAGRVIQIENKSLQKEEPIFLLSILGDDFKNYQVLFFEAVDPQLLKERIEFGGTLVGKYPFEEDSGKTLAVYFLLGSYMEKGK